MPQTSMYLDRPLPYAVEFMDPRWAERYERSGHDRPVAERIATRSESFAGSGEALSFLREVGARRFGLIRRNDIRDSGGSWAWTPEVLDAGEGGWEPLHWRS